MDQVYNLTQAYSQAPWRKQLQIIGLFLLALVFIALVAGIYLNVTARAASVGRDIQGLQKQIDEIQDANADLQSKLAFMTSTSEMQRRARDLGFKAIETDQTMFLSVPDYIERQPVVLAPAPGPITVGAPAMPPEYTESLFEWLRKELLRSSFLMFEVRQ